jgi:predicted ABC-type ATPase
MTKTIYVVGGTNGVGKSTIRKQLLGPSIPYINADFIAHQLKGQQASLMLAEETGLKLMRHYFPMPDKILMIDNTHISYSCLEAEKGKIVFYPSNSPQWIKAFVNSLENKSVPLVKSLNSIDEVRSLYRKSQKRDEEI